MWKPQKTMSSKKMNNNINIGEMDKSRELYSKEGDNSSQFEDKKSDVGAFFFNL